MTMARSQPDRTSARPNYRRYWLALYRREVATAEQVVDLALERWSPQRIYLRLFMPALNLSGTLWSRGTISHHDEHFVTHHTLRFMRRVRRRFVPPETHGPLALATGVGPESHMIGLRMVCDFLTWANWRIHWLSSNDRATVAGVAERLRPDAVLLSLGIDPSITPAGRLIADLRRRRFPGLIAIGGRAVNCNPQLVDQLGADLTAPDAASLVRILRPRFPQMRRMKPAPDPQIGRNDPDNEESAPTSQSDDLPPPYDRDIVPKQLRPSTQAD
jgi:MerR family transcriptional regulator, light-induced transcriptional regulator